LKGAAIRISIFSGDTFPQAPSNAGEYHMQTNLAAHLALSMMLFREWLAAIGRPGDSGGDCLAHLFGSPDHDAFRFAIEKGP
jgi:hypothetical protein